MHVTNRQAGRASRPGIMVATYWLAAGIAMIAFSERVHAEPRGGDTVAFARPATTLNAGDIRLLVFRQDSNRPLDLDAARQLGDNLGVEAGTAVFRDRRDPDVLAISTSSHRMRSKRPKASHSRLRRAN